MKIRQTLLSGAGRAGAISRQGLFKIQSGVAAAADSFKKNRVRPGRIAAAALLLTTAAARGAGAASNATASVPACSDNLGVNYVSQAVAAGVVILSLGATGAMLMKARQAQKPRE